LYSDAYEERGYRDEAGEPSGNLRMLRAQSVENRLDQITEGVGLAVAHRPRTKVVGAVRAIAQHRPVHYPIARADSAVDVGELYQVPAAGGGQNSQMES
jgi:hypothetical protein